MEYATIYSAHGAALHTALAVRRPSSRLTRFVKATRLALVTFDPSQPRDPAGLSTGGQWSGGGAGGIPSITINPLPLAGDGAATDAIDSAYPLESIIGGFITREAAAVISALGSAAIREAVSRIGDVVEDIIARHTANTPLRGRTDSERAADAAQRLRDTGWDDPKSLGGARLGKFKGPVKWYNQIANRGWKPSEIRDLIKSGTQKKVTNNIHPGNRAIRYQGRQENIFVTIDDVTGEILQLSDKNDPNFKSLRTKPNAYGLKSQDNATMTGRGSAMTKATFDPTTVIVPYLDNEWNEYAVVSITHIKDNIYRLAERKYYNPEPDEVWKFPPGSYVHVEHQNPHGDSDGGWLMAVALAEPPQ